MINIKQTIASGNAATSTQGKLLLLAMQNSTTKTIVLDFDGLESCNSLFINTSIGVYFMQENRKEVRFLNVATVWQWKIDKAINLAENEALRDFHNGLLQQLINE